MTDLSKVVTSPLFCYGTLRPSEKATHFIAGYHMYDYGKFPYIVKGSGDSYVYGNLCEVSEEEWPELDAYEGVRRGLYTREKTIAYPVGYSLLSEGKECYVYVATNNIHPQRIDSGDWFNR